MHMLGDVGIADEMKLGRCSLRCARCWGGMIEMQGVVGIADGEMSPSGKSEE